MSRPPEGPKLRPNKKRGGTYYIFYTDRSGRSRERSAGTRDREEAHRAFADWLNAGGGDEDVGAGGIEWTGPRRAAQASIADVLAMYAQEHATEHTASPATVRYSIQALLGWWGGRTCDFITPQTCRAYVRARTNGGAGDKLSNSTTSGLYRREAIVDAAASFPSVENAREGVRDGSFERASPDAARAEIPTPKNRKALGVASATAGRELTTLNAALGYAHKNGKLIERPFVEIPQRPPSRQRWLTRSEAARLLWESRRDVHARHHLPLFILLALTTGARPAALFDLRWTQIDFANNRIDFNPAGRQQTSKHRPIISIPRRLRWFLLRAHARASSPYVLSYYGRKLTTVKNSFRKAATRAGLGSDVVPYTLRHSAGTYLAQAGVPLWQIGGWLGHSQARTTELYAHHHPDHMSAARKVMD